MPTTSAGILLYRKNDAITEVLLVHPGGPFWAKKDTGAWSIPKGEININELPEVAARREFFEETGIEITGPLQALTPVKLKSGKTIIAFTQCTNLDVTACRSNHFEMEWPPRSGKRQSFPEVDKYAWFSIQEAATKINEAMIPLLYQLPGEV